MTAGPTRTLAFADRWAPWSWLAPALVLTTMCVAPSAERTIHEETVTVPEEEAHTSAPFTLPSRAWGGVRLTADAQIDWNRWAGLQVSLIDAAGESLLDVVKEAWAETGTWREGGESGTWAESDRALEWHLRIARGEPVRLRLTVLETGAADGSPLTFSVPVRLRVTSGVVDMRLLGAALFLSTAFAVLATYAAGHGGRPVIVTRRTDSEVKGRAAMGGAGRLVAISVAGEVDEHAPAQVQVTIVVRAEDRRKVYEVTEAAPVTFHKDDHGTIEDGRFSVRLNLELPEAAIYGVDVEVSPHGPMENLKLLVRDGATTRGPVEVVTVAARQVAT